MFTATRFHDFSAGHRVVGHENKCAHLHGHNYRVHFHCRAVEFKSELDHVGRVIDFSVIKAKLCQWLEDNWDHRFLIWCDDPTMCDLLALSSGRLTREYETLLKQSMAIVPFNPTAENMAEYLVEAVAVEQLQGTHVELYKCVVEETRKCSATYEQGNPR